MLGMLGGCATPERRIRANPELFAGLSAEEQELVKAGRVEIGMGMGAVKLSLGGPDRVYTRRTAEGEATVWSYVRRELSSRTEFVTVHSRFRGIETVPVQVEDSREVEVLRLEFHGDQLEAIEARER